MECELFEKLSKEALKDRENVIRNFYNLVCIEIEKLQYDLEETRSMLFAETSFVDSKINKEMLDLLKSLKEALTTDISTTDYPTATDDRLRFYVEKLIKFVKNYEENK